MNQLRPLRSLLAYREHQLRQAELKLAAARQELDQAAAKVIALRHERDGFPGLAQLAVDQLRGLSALHLQCTAAEALQLTAQTKWEAARSEYQTRDAAKAAVEKHLQALLAELRGVAERRLTQDLEDRYLQTRNAQNGSS